MFQRNEMVERQIIRRGVSDPRVIEAMRKVKRHLFVPALSENLAYEDYPLPIGHGQTISQPFIVAYMTEAAQLRQEDRVLEIGTGSGYQAAILAEIVAAVYSVEILKPLADEAEIRFQALGYKNIFVKHGDGYQGWEEHAPYDVIIVTAAPGAIPPKLIEQLKVGGRLVIPVGTFFQELYLITKTKDGIETKSMLPVKFVPMVPEED
ncbi:MAG: protein-L-isoaspartate O-methyltransferase [Omnitrophica WOR_2 bacterium GWA2_45_18]|nr:MAG: protein-L-isoaspartate O-methyltransferase [Omnitrophica WOR_2 bacterium GWA2_45_18]